MSYHEVAFVFSMTYMCVILAQTLVFVFLTSLCSSVGMTAALEAKRLGLNARIIERKYERSKHDSRAVVVHPRVMELLEPIRDKGVVKDIEKTAFQIEGVYAYVKKGFSGCCKKVGDEAIDSFDRLNLNMRIVEWGDTDYPNLYFLPQYETEHILEQAMIADGMKVDYGFALENLTQDCDSVTATIRNEKDDSTETVTSRWLLGCDGGRSKTRDLVGITLNRHTSGLYFIIADVVFKGDSPFTSDGIEKRGHVFVQKNGSMALLPLPGKNAYRLAGRAPAGITHRDQIKMDETFFKNFVYDISGLDVEVELGQWQTVFEISHGASDSYINGNVMLAGDASHVHSPIGGQGMNLGMQDANNVLWKLAWAKRTMDAVSSEEEKATAKAAAGVILHSYHSERHFLGQGIVKSVDITTRTIMSLNPFIQLLRNILLRAASRFNAARSFFRKGGQLELFYAPESSKLIFDDKLPKKGITSPGQRLPNIRLNDGSYLHFHIDRERHTWVFLNTKPTKATSIGGKMVHATPAKFEAQVSVPVIAKNSFAVPQVLLVRPDQFVAGVASTQQELIEQLQKVGLSENALMAM